MSNDSRHLEKSTIRKHADLTSRLHEEVYAEPSSKNLERTRYDRATMAHREQSLRRDSQGNVTALSFDNRIYKSVQDDQKSTRLSDQNRAKVIIQGPGSGDMKIHQKVEIQTAKGVTEFSYQPTSPNFVCGSGAVISKHRDDIDRTAPVNAQSKSLSEADVSRLTAWLKTTGDTRWQSANYNVFTHNCCDYSKYVLRAADYVQQHHSMEGF